MQKEGKLGLWNLETGILVNCQQFLIIEVIMAMIVLGYSLSSFITINRASFILKFSLFGKLITNLSYEYAFVLLEHRLTLQSYQ